MTPDLLLDQGQSTEVNSEEEQVMQTIYNILRQGYGPTPRVEVLFRYHNALVMNDNCHVRLTIFTFSQEQ